MSVVNLVNTFLEKFMTTAEMRRDDKQERAIDAGEEIIDLFRLYMKYVRDIIPIDADKPLFRGIIRIEKEFIKQEKIFKKNN